jgi:hypothetical protein
VIRRITLSTGEVAIVAGTLNVTGAISGPASEARFHGPTGLVHDGKSSLYVADSGNGVIRRVDLAAGFVTTEIGIVGQHGFRMGALPGILNQPGALALLPSRGLVIADQQENAIVVRVP